jgi:multidrug efflux pump subunit AcrA (membrane-fusion protein)
MDSLDKLLDELKAEYDQGKSPGSQPQKNTAKSSTPPPPKSLSLEDSLLAQVRADFAEQDALAELQKQQAIEQEQIRQAEMQAQRLAALQGEAQAWLKTLDPFSSEGLWFARFAEGYPSKLEAAMEYLLNNPSTS